MSNIKVNIIRKKDYIKYKHFVNTLDKNDKVVVVKSNRKNNLTNQNEEYIISVTY